MIPLESGYAHDRVAIAPAAQRDAPRAHAHHRLRTKAKQTQQITIKVSTKTTFISTLLGPLLMASPGGQLQSRSGLLRILPRSLILPR